MISQRGRLHQQISMTKNRLHGVPRPSGESFSHRFNLIPPKGQLCSDETRPWWQEQDFSPIVHIQIEPELLILEHLSAHQEALHQELACLSNRQPGASEMVFLMQIPGRGVVLSLTVLAAGVHDSGLKYQGQGIPRGGTPSPKRVAKNSARPWSQRAPQKIGTLWHVVGSAPYWKSQYEDLKKRGKHANEALVAVARKMRVAVWQVLSKREPDRQATPADLAYKMVTESPLRGSGLSAWTQTLSVA